MHDPDTISADYTLRPSEVAATLKVLIDAKQPVMVWGPPGCAKSEVAQQVAAETGRSYYDVRGLLLDPVDLRGIPWRDTDNRRVNPSLLGMSKVASEDSVRRGLERIEAEDGTSWLHGHLDDTVRPLLSEPWVLDCDTTIKPLYGHQEGAVVSYNPKKPGRPSHAYHAFLMAGTRLVLDVDVAPGNRHRSKSAAPSLWALLDRLGREHWPHPPVATGHRPSEREGMISSESRMRESRTSGLMSGGLETRPREPDCGPERKGRASHRTLKLARQPSTPHQSLGAGQSPDPNRGRFPT